jgi:hypothetical protein
MVVGFALDWKWKWKWIWNGATGETPHPPPFFVAAAAIAAIVVVVVDRSRRLQVPLVKHLLYIVMRFREFPKRLCR